MINLNGFLANVEILEIVLKNTVFNQKHLKFLNILDLSLIYNKNLIWTRSDVHKAQKRRKTDFGNKNSSKN